MTETYGVIITIVGTTEGGSAFSDELHALFEKVQDLLPEAMPSFVLALPPVSITTYELLSPPEHRRYSPLIATAEHEVLTAARVWKRGTRGAAARLRQAIDDYEAFPGDDEEDDE